MEEIKALNEEGMKLFHNHDIDALMTCYVPDATFMPPGMDVVRGKDGRMLRVNTASYTSCTRQDANILPDV